MNIYHHIYLKKGTKYSYRVLYDISHKKNKKLCKYLLKNLEKRFIRVGKSLAIFTVLIILKPQNGLQFYFKY